MGSKRLIPSQYIGKSFGQLKVVSKAPPDRFGKAMVVCKCLCGKTITTNLSQLISGRNKTCGHKRKGLESHRWTGYEEISGFYWGHIQQHCIRGGKTIKFKITKQYVWDLFMEQERKCAISGVEIFFTDDFRGKRKDQTASLDRIDSNKGYIKGNVQWVHKDINRMKWHLPEKVFLNWCRLVIKNKGKI